MEFNIKDYFFLGILVALVHPFHSEAVALYGFLIQLLEKVKILYRKVK